ncbi:unnamed protein product, partial [Vitis vinifera]
MVCLLKLGKTHHLQTLRLEGHLEIMIQSMLWRLVKDGERLAASSRSSH